MTQITKYQTKQKSYTFVELEELIDKVWETSGMPPACLKPLLDQVWELFEEVPKKPKKKGRKKSNHRQLDDEHYDGVEIWDTPKY